MNIGVGRLTLFVQRDLGTESPRVVLDKGPVSWTETARGDVLHPGQMPTEPGAVQDGVGNPRQKDDFDR
jgi:hypothetical protein